MAKYEVKNGVGIIPEGTTEIVDRGFKECKELVEVTIPQGVTRIGKYAFCECTNLKKVVIPDSVKIIDDLCFDRCTSLKSIAIPKSAEKVSIFFAYYCNDLESIVVEEGNPVYDSRDNCNALIMVDEKKKSVLLRGCKNTVIPNTVKKIGEYAYVRVNGLVSVTIPDSVSEIGHCNFMECPDLKEIVIPYSVKKIGEGCFCDCQSLNRLTILGSISKLYAWEGSPNIEELTFGEGIKSVSKDFKDIDCPKLKVINVPKGTADYYKGLLPAKYHSLIKEEDIDLGKPAQKSKKQGKILNIMAELNINGRMMVKNFKRQFKKEFGGSLRVYKGQNLADDDATLASIRAEGHKGGELTLRANMLVGTFEEKMQELFGIKVQVADADDKKLVDNALTLGAVGRGEVKKKAAAAGTCDCAATQTGEKECQPKGEAAGDGENLKGFKNVHNFTVTLWSDKMYIAKESYGYDIDLDEMSEEEIREYVTDNHEEIMDEWDNEEVIECAAIGEGDDEESCKVADSEGNEADHWDWFDGCYQHYRAGEYYKDFEGNICKAVLEEEDDPSSVVLEEADDYRVPRPGVRLYRISKYMSEMQINCEVKLPVGEEFDPENVVFESKMMPRLFADENLQSIDKVWYNDIECERSWDGPALRDMGIVVVKIAEDGSDKIIYSDFDETDLIFDKQTGGSRKS